MNIKQVVKEIFSNIKKDWYLPVTERQVYSTEEQVVGTWTDGKPIYRRTIKSFSTNVKEDVIIDVSEWNIDEIVNLYGTANRVYNASLSFVYSFNSWESSSYWTFIRYDESEKTIRYKMYYEATTKQTINVEYTKTTDTPTTSKVPFEPLIEYSTNEKMIGYWVDGKPLYRKTIRVDNVPVNSETALDHNIQNVDLIWFKKDASWMYDTSEQGTWALGAANSNVSYHFFDVWANRTKYSIDLRGFAAGRVSYAYITFEYTKTTD